MKLILRQKTRRPPRVSEELSPSQSDSSISRRSAVISTASYTEGNHLQNINFLYSISAYFYQLKHRLVLGKEHPICDFKENNSFRENPGRIWRM